MESRPWMRWLRSTGSTWMDDPMTVFLFLVSTLAGSGGVAAIVVKLLDRRRDKGEVQRIGAEADRLSAERTDIISKASERTVHLMQQQLDRAFERINQLEETLLRRDARIDELDRQVEQLKREIRRLTFGT